MAKPKKRKILSTIITGALAVTFSTFLAGGSTLMLFWLASGFAVAATVLEAYQFGLLIGFGLFSLGFILTGPILEALLITTLALLPVVAVGIVLGAVMAASIWGIYKLYSGDMFKQEVVITEAPIEAVAEKMSLKTMAIIAGVAAASALGASITMALLAVLAPGVLIAAASLPAALAGLIVFTVFCAEVFILETMAAVSIAAVAGLIAAALIPSIAVGALLTLTYLGAFDPIFDYVKTKLSFEKIEYQITSESTSFMSEVSEKRGFEPDTALNTKLFQPANTAASPSSSSFLSYGTGTSQSDD